jgi:hypothetical protein
VSNFNSFNELHEMPFVAWIPSSHVFRHFTVRNDGKKWNTIRYFVEINGREIRVKEFFMDWFFPGFPKSIMDTLYSTYSPVTALERDGRLLFLGTNYKGNPAASGYLDGTTVEIESLSGEAMEEMTELFFDLAADPDDEASKCDMPFHERSFFSAGHQGAWFEDNRISRMSWKKGEPGIGINEYSLWEPWQTTLALFRRYMSFRTVASTGHSGWKLQGGMLILSMHTTE